MMKRDEKITRSGDSELSEELSELLEKRRVDDPGSEFWNSYYDKLTARMHAEETQFGLASRIHGRLENVKNLLLPSPRLVWQLGLGVLLVVAGVLFGRYGLDRSSLDSRGLASSSESAAPNQGLNTDASAPSETAVVRAHAVLGRSRTLLLGMVNFNVNEDDPSGLAVSRRRDMARALIDESATLSNELAASDQHQLSFLITELEVILLQIANMEQDFDIAGIELIQKGVDKKSLLFKIDIAEMRRLDDNISLETRKSDKTMS